MFWLRQRHKFKWVVTLRCVSTLSQNTFLLHCYSQAVNRSLGCQRKQHYTCSKLNKKTSLNNTIYKHLALKKNLLSFILCSQYHITCNKIICCSHRTTFITCLSINFYGKHILLVNIQRCHKMLGKNVNKNYTTYLFEWYLNSINFSV